MFKLHTLTQSLIWLTIFLTLACASKGKKVSDDDVLNTQGEPIDLSANISSKELSFDAQGSDSGDLPIKTVNFNFDTYHLTTKTRQILAENAGWIKENKGFNIQIEGHCDQRGSTEYNLALGEKRAQSVKIYLQNLGIQNERLETISYGEEKLLSEGDSETSHIMNRRVNFVLIKK